MAWPTAVAQHPDRLVGMGTVPLAECRNGGRGNAPLRAAISTCAESRSAPTSTASTSTPRNCARSGQRPEELGVLIFIHPLGFTEGPTDERRYYFNNLIGNPLESTLAVGHLIFGGVLRSPIPASGSALRMAAAIFPVIGDGWIMDGAPAATAPEHCQHPRLPAICESSGSTRWCSIRTGSTASCAPMAPTGSASGTDYPFDMCEPRSRRVPRPAGRGGQGEDPGPQRRRSAGFGTSGWIEQAARRDVPHTRSGSARPRAAQPTGLRRGINT